MTEIVNVHFPDLQKNLLREALNVFYDIREVPGRSPRTRRVHSEAGTGSSPTRGPCSPQASAGRSAGRDTVAMKKAVRSPNWPSNQARWASVRL